MFFRSKKFFLLLFVFLVFSLVLPRLVLALTDEDCVHDLQGDRSNLDACIKLWSGIREQKSSEIVSLQSELKKFNASIAITTAQIYRTISEIESLEKEIAGLSAKIGHLDLSLNEISEIFIKRIAATYKKGKIDPLVLLLSSDNFSEFVSRYKYLRVIQTHDRKLMIQMETVRTNYEGQKTAKEEKQTELEQAKKKLESQKALLAQQKEAKANLLAATENDEKKYEVLLSKARAQLAAMRRFVISQGGATILNDQTKCDDWGCYYNQRDSLWGSIGMGGSSYSVAEYGCLVTSVSMVASHYGKNIKPGDIALNPSAFVPETGYLYHSFIANGMSVKLTVASKGSLDSELSAGRPVIAGLYSGPDHFIVILKKEGDSYKMHDPFLENGSNRPLSDEYSVNDITSLRLVSFN